MANATIDDYNLKDWVQCCVTKADISDDIGLELEQNQYTKQFFITTVRNGSLAKMFSDIKVGDRLLKFQNKDATEYQSVSDIMTLLKTSMKIHIETVHHQYSNQKVELDMTVTKGDIVHLTSYTSNPELNGEKIQVLREGNQSGYWLVEILKTKEKILVTVDNLYYEILTEKLELKDSS